jgi:hypothetical protein
MTLDHKLTPVLEKRLKEEAERRHLSASECALELLRSQLPELDRRAAAVAALQAMYDEGDEQEQRETGDFLIKALDEDRLSDRKLFPAELKGITW